MSDLVKRLRDDVWGGGGVMTSLMRESADKIEQLERELAAEKALADKLYRMMSYGSDEACLEAMSDYRKARAL